MAQLKVIVNKLNRRRAPITNFSEKGNVTGTVLKGFQFVSVSEESNDLGKWYKDRDGNYYWGGGLMIVNPDLPITFNIKNLPLNLPVPCRIGIDVSHHNFLPDWSAIKNSGASFAYIKISEGVGTPDEKAGSHAIAAKQNGFRIGYYHFCRPDTRNGGTIINDATAEADEAINRMSVITKPDLPLVLDLEDQNNWDTPLSPVDYLLWVTTFINRIKEKFSMECMIYSRKEYLDRKLPRDHGLGKHKLWISFYSARDYNKVVCPIGWNEWAMWQYCEDGVIGGNSNLDINILKDQSLF